MWQLLTTKNEYLEQGKLGKNTVWTYVLSALMLLLAVFVISPMAYMLLVVLHGINNPDFLQAVMTVDNPFLWPIPVWHTILATGLCFLVISLFILLITKYIHKRPVISLFTNTKFNYGLMLKSLFIFVSLLSISSVIEYFLFPSDFSIVFDAKLFFITALSCLIAISIQAGTEELLFRGYLNQILYKIFNTPLIPVLLTSLIFGALHFANPEVLNETNISKQILIGSSYIILAIFASLITLRSNGLEQAFGLHIGNNLFLTIILGYKDSALISSTIFHLESIHIEYSFVSLIVVCALFYYISNKFLIREV